MLFGVQNPLCPDLEPRILKMPHLRSIRELKADMDISGTQLTERALSTLASEEPVAMGARSRFSITNEDDDNATFDAEFSDRLR